MRNGLCLQNIPSSLCFHPCKCARARGAEHGGWQAELTAPGVWKDAQTFGSVQDPREPSIPAALLWVRPTPRWAQDLEFPPLCLTSISQQRAAGTAQGTLPCQGLPPTPAVLCSPLCKGLAFFLALLLFLLKCSSFLSYTCFLYQMFSAVL